MQIEQHDDNIFIFLPTVPLSKDFEYFCICNRSSCIGSGVGGKGLLFCPESAWSHRVCDGDRSNLCSSGLVRQTLGNNKIN